MQGHRNAFAGRFPFFGVAQRGQQKRSGFTGPARDRQLPSCIVRFLPACDAYFGCHRQDDKLARKMHIASPVPPPQGGMKLPALQEAARVS